jgi:hypothetical protein
MLECHSNHPGTFVRSPVLEKLIPSFSPTILRARFFLTKSIWSSEGKVPLDVVNRIKFIGILFVSLGQQDGGSDVHRLSPEIREQFALEFDPLDPLRIRFHLNRWDNMIACDLNSLGLGGIDMDPLNITVHIAWRSQPVLPLPLVIVKPHRIAIGALEPGIDIDKTLNIVFSRWDVTDAL